MVRKLTPLLPIKNSLHSPLHGMLRPLYFKLNKESILFADDLCDKIMGIIAPNCKETLYFPTVNDMRLETFLDQISFAKRRIRLSPLSSREKYLLEVHMCHHIVNVVESVLIGDGHPFRHFRNEDVHVLEEDMDVLESFVKTWPVHPDYEEHSKFRNFRLVFSHEAAILKVVKLREILATYFSMDIKGLKELLDADIEDKHIIEGVIFHRHSKK